MEVCEERTSTRRNLSESTRRSRTTSTSALAAASRWRRASDLEPGALLGDQSRDECGHARPQARARRGRRPQRLLLRTRVPARRSGAFSRAPPPTKMDTAEQDKTCLLRFFGFVPPADRRMQAGHVARAQAGVRVAMAVMADGHTEVSPTDMPHLRSIPGRAARFGPLDLDCAGLVTICERDQRGAGENERAPLTHELDIASPSFVPYGILSLHRSAFRSTRYLLGTAESPSAPYLLYRDLPYLHVYQSG
jgi:hypothetical protein